MNHGRFALLLLASLLMSGCHGTGFKNGERAQQGYTNTQSRSAGQPSADSGQAPAGSVTGQPSAANPAAHLPPSPADAPALAITVPAGTVLSVRLNQTLNVKTVSTSEQFTGSLVNPVTSGASTVVPAGSVAEGIVLRAHRRGRFKGASVLQLKLTGLNVSGHHYLIDTGALTRSKRGKGRRSAAFIGGGSGLGMLIGGVASGGVGLVIGGLAGAGAGTAATAFTGNKDITLPAESVVSFRLNAPLRLE